MSQDSQRWSHAEKVKYMLEDLPTKGVSAYTAAPPLFRLLWKLGIPVPPPLFLGFFPNAISMGCFFALVWGLLMWLWNWRQQNMPPEVAISLSLLAGGLFGPFMAWYLLRKARNLGLPPWRDYGPPS